MKKAIVLGGGLAGCEAAMQLANRGIKVTLYEMKPVRKTPAHKSDLLAELVCSNSLKANRVDSAAGLLKEEMRILGSVCLKSADQSLVPAGGALAVDRNIFSKYITDEIYNHPNITVKNEIVEESPKTEVCVVATGPLTDGKLAEEIEALCEDGSLSFFDAAAPIVTGNDFGSNKSQGDIPS